MRCSGEILFLRSISLIPRDCNYTSIRVSQLTTPNSTSWKSWTHPQTSTTYSLTITAATALSNPDLESCFKLIELTSSEDYKKSKDGWKPRSKRSEMKLLDLKYVLVKNEQGDVEGFCSFMPTYEDGCAVVYIYEIHLALGLQGLVGFCSLSLSNTLPCPVTSFSSRLLWFSPARN